MSERKDGKKQVRKRKVRVGDWIATFGKVTMLHGEEELVLQIGGGEVTVLRAECWSEEKDVEVAAKKRHNWAKPGGSHE